MKLRFKINLILADNFRAAIKRTATSKNAIHKVGVTISYL